MYFAPKVSNLVGPPPSISLDEAYFQCEAITRHYSRTFFLATRFLPREKRRAIRALYAFCRVTDNLVDEPQSGPVDALERWSRHALEDHPRRGGDPVLQAWADTRRRYHLPDEVILDLLAGVRMDLTISRYQNFEALEHYAYCVASTVGLLSMHIIGHSPGAESDAIQLGIALQLTNILRDVGEDAGRGRVYLPLDELARYDLTAEEVLGGVRDERYHALMAFQIARVHRMYENSLPGIRRLDRSGRFAVAAAAYLYRDILPAIERNRYDNHARRAYVPGWRKMILLPRAALTVLR